MEKELTINEVLGQYKNRNLKVKDLWYDWFCKDSSLENKGKSLLQKLNAIRGSTKFDKDKTSVFFKNNCPCFGSLYDDFRICDLESGDVIYNVVPKSGYRKDNGMAMVYGKENDFKEPLVSGTWQEVKEWFLK